MQEIGIRSGQTVHDFGSYLGMSTVPAAGVVGRGRRVYALDNDKEALDELAQRAKSAALRKIRRMETSGKLGIDLADESVAVVLLFDVFHSFYFPHEGDRHKLLDGIRRIMKPSACLWTSVWPNLIEPRAEIEIENRGSCLANKASETLDLHDRNLRKRSVPDFRKG